MAVEDLFAVRTWFLKNEDSGQELQGQFEPENLVDNVGVKYAKINALNRQNPIVQFISGDARTVTFVARLFARDSLFKDAKDSYDLLKKWAERDPNLERPPILSFWVGDGMMSMALCVIESLGGITFDRPTFGGAWRGATLPITLLKYEPFSLESVEGGETRYHRAKFQDYYEMLTYREYGDAMIGDVIRKRHPSKPNIQIGDIIKLPSVQTLRRERTSTKSIPLQTAYGRKETPQRRLRLEMFEKRDRDYVSHIVIE